MQQAAARGFADWIADKVRTPAIPYVEGGISEKGTDCINLIRWALWELTGVMYERGSNSAWRKDMVWRGTIAEAKALGYLVPGAIVYILDPPTAKWPDGDYGHAGVYVGFDYGLKNPDGKPADVVHASSSRKGVYGSILAKNAWTHVALHVGVYYALAGIDADTGTEHEPEPVEEEPTTSGQTSTTTATKAAPGPGQAMVRTNDKDGLNLRKQANKKAKGIKLMPDDTIVDVLDTANGWAYVRYVAKDGVPHEGWCSAEFLVFG